MTGDYYTPTVVPQTTYDPTTTTWGELPEELERRCCPRKRHNTTVFKTRVATIDDSSPTGASVIYTYKRENGDTFIAGATIAELVEGLNDETNWPVVEN